MEVRSLEEAESQALGPLERTAPNEGAIDANDLAPEIVLASLGDRLLRPCYWSGRRVWCRKYQSGRSIRRSPALRFARVVFASFGQCFDVERAVKQQDE